MEGRRRGEIMSPLLLGLFVLGYVLVFVFVLSLCRVAAQADEEAARMRKEMLP
jgi:hypothetical protein